MTAVAAQPTGEATGSPSSPTSPNHATTELPTDPDATRDATTGDSNPRRLLTAAAALPATPERPLRALAPAEATGAVLSPRATRAGPRVAVFVEAADTDGESAAADPVDPAEPAVSANANGTDAIAEPTPNATANAPTRPTYREYPAVPVTARRRYSIARTCHFEPRRPRPMVWNRCVDGIEGLPKIWYRRR